MGTKDTGIDPPATKTRNTTKQNFRLVFLFRVFVMNRVVKRGAMRSLRPADGQ
jgi:hypothetical protein